MSDFNQAKYIQKYQKEKYDRLIFNVPKGEKAKIQNHYKKKGYASLNQYINDLVKKDMEKSNITVGDITQTGNNNSISIS